MKKHLLALGALFLALLMGGCNTSSQAPSSEKYQVRVSVAFPQRNPSPTSISPQGVPVSAQSAEITAIRQDTGHVADTCSLSSNNPTCSLGLQPGNYSIEASVKNFSGTEVAWVSQSLSVTGDTSISLVPKTILANAFLSADGNTASAGAQVAVRLWVTYPDGPQPPYAPDDFPLDDFDVVYTVGTCSDGSCTSFTENTGVATIAASNKLGAMVQIGPGVPINTWIGLKAEITGLGEDHQPKTLTKYFAIRVADVSVGVSIDLSPPFLGQINIDGQQASYPAQVTMGTHTLSGWAFDNDKVAAIKVYINFSEVQATVTGLNTPNPTWSYNWTPSAPGRYYLHVVAYDAAGNSHFRYLPIDVH